MTAPVDRRRRNGRPTPDDLLAADDEPYLRETATRRDWLTVAALATGITAVAGLGLWKLIELLGDAAT